MAARETALRDFFVAELRPFYWLLPVCCPSTMSAVQRDNKWKAEIFACADEPCICLTACCCFCSTTGQVAQKAAGASCACIAIALWVLFTVQIAAQFGSQAANRARFNVDTSGSAWRILRILPLILIIVSCGATLAQASIRTSCLARSRDKIVAKDGIPYEGPVYTCCCSFWCFPCATTQLLRQLGYGQGGDKQYPGFCAALPEDEPAV